MLATEEGEIPPPPVDVSNPQLTLVRYRLSVKTEHSNCPGFTDC